LGFHQQLNYYHTFIQLDLTEKEVAGAFWNGEVESECREMGCLDFFGLMHVDADREKVMEKIELLR
jgi:hypothetical protein